MVEMLICRRRSNLEQLSTASPVFYAGSCPAATMTINSKNGKASQSASTVPDWLALFSETVRIYPLHRILLSTARQLPESCLFCDLMLDIRRDNVWTSCATDV
jgi:hypothetical protein